MAASLLHAAASSPLAGPYPAARAAFRPLASSPFLRLARSSPDRRARLDFPLRALSGGARLSTGVAALRPRRFVAASRDARAEIIAARLYNFRFVESTEDNARVYSFRAIFVVPNGKYLQRCFCQCIEVF